LKNLVIPLRAMLNDALDDGLVLGMVTLLLGAPKSGKGGKVDVPQALVDKLSMRRGIMEAEAALNGQGPYR